MRLKRIITNRYLTTTAIRLNNDNSSNADDVMKGLFRSRRSQSIIKQDTNTDSVENSSGSTRQGPKIDIRKVRMMRKSLSPTMRIQNMIEEKSEPDDNSGAPAIKK